MYVVHCTYIYKKWKDKIQGRKLVALYSVFLKIKTFAFLNYLINFAQKQIKKIKNKTIMCCILIVDYKKKKKLKLK